MSDLCNTFDLASLITEAMYCKNPEKSSCYEPYTDK